MHSAMEAGSYGSNVASRSPRISGAVEVWLATTGAPQDIASRIGKARSLVYRGEQEKGAGLIERAELRIGYVARITSSPSPIPASAAQACISPASEGSIRQAITSWCEARNAGANRP